MLSRREILRVSLVIFATVGQANGLETVAYDKALADRAIRSGAPVVVHVYAPWCLQCRAQASLLEKMSSNKQLGRITLFRVDYDGQKSVVDALGVSRSTLIAYKGGKEVARMSWGTSREDVERVLQAAL